jgi:beta-galactosidase
MPADALATVDRAPVALVFDFSAHWMMQIQPHGADMNYFGLLFTQYVALRSLGLDVDIVAPTAPLDGYAMVVLPALLSPPQALVERLAALDAVVVIGPRSGSKTPHLGIPANLPPGPLAAGMPVRVGAVESLRPGLSMAVTALSQQVGEGRQWRDIVQPLSDSVDVLASYADGAPAWLRNGRWFQQAGMVDTPLQQRWLAQAAQAAGLATQELPEGLRLRRRGALQFAIHRGPGEATVPAPADAQFLLGSRVLPAGGVAAWRIT